MFEPGHLHIVHSALQKTDHSFDIHLRYQKVEDPAEGTCMSFDMQGEIDGKAFNETFVLPRDLAFNFAHEASRIAIRHGLPNPAGLPIAQHADYDRMFEDIRAQLHARSGEPVKPEHLER
ncbi:DUF5064 family protein [Pseudomonas sp. DTU_2021_1001937_2_SI_NGA_ILE_001]|uniref:DUF5064 family protein n=1 Tax=Pseudomonas sp. DTU_2021_1001937_2_SI_NGA_ILE_001 TaxID=3077589 RepID=UPI0025D722B3|nr:DUF5064 family protein [Pseudomonas sp. DTU_2021_1001937_2_SI_NGA_ILE_001]WNW13580.1 DUF5064 family protein [Pseudomonas sp. DTU_2021_1001937_2_SI_NGA_ILE_001]